MFNFSARNKFPFNMTKIQFNDCISFASIKFPFRPKWITIKSIYNAILILNFFQIFRSLPLRLIYQQYQVQDKIVNPLKEEERLPYELHSYLQHFKTQKNLLIYHLMLILLFHSTVHYENFVLLYQYFPNNLVPPHIII